MGADAGNGGTTVAVGKIRGLNVLEPDGKRRIFRCLLADLGTLSSGYAKPHDAGPKEPLERNELGLDAEDGMDR